MYWWVIEKTEKSDMLAAHRIISRGGQANFLKSPQIANPQFLWLSPLLQILKFLRCANPHIANPQNFMVNSKITTPGFLQNSAQLCLKTVLKVVFKNSFLLSGNLN
jgi:hypothetical protein